MKGFLGGKKVYAVNLTSSGGIAAEVLVINTPVQPVPVQVIGGITANVNIPNPMPVVVQNAVTVAGVQSPVAVSGTVNVGNTVNVNVANASVPISNGPGGPLNVQFPSAQPVTISGQPVNVSVTQPIQSRVYNRLAGGNPDYQDLWVAVSQMPPVSLAPNQTVQVAQPIRVRNADPPNDHLNVNITGPLSGGRVRVIHETTLDTRITNTTAQAVPVHLHTVDSAASILVRNTAAQPLHTDTRLTQVDPSVGVYVYNRVLSGSNVVDPAAHSGGNKKFLEVRVDSAPDRPVHVAFTGNPIEVRLGDIELDADLFDYRLPVKLSGYERIHWGRHDRTDPGGPFGYTVPFVIEAVHSASDFSTDPTVRYRKRFYIDTRHAQREDVPPETGYVQIGPNRVYAPGLNAFRRFLITVWAALTPNEAGANNPWKGFVDFSTTLGSRPSSRPPMMYWGYNPLLDGYVPAKDRDHANVVRTFMKRGGERITVSVYRVDYRRPLTPAEASDHYNWGAYSAARHEIDRIMPGEANDQIEIYGKLVARTWLGLNQLQPFRYHGSGYGACDHLIYGRAELIVEGPVSGLVIEFDYSGLREADRLGPILRYGSSYVGNPARRYLNHIPSGVQLVMGGVIHGIHSA